MKKLWQLRRDWSANREKLDNLIADLRKETGLSPLSLRACVMRGLETPDEIRKYFFPKLENLKHPFSIRDMDCAVDRLIYACQTQEKILVYGDYDVDGTCSVALLKWFFNEIHVPVEIAQPDRFIDGYGLNIQAVESASAAGVKVLISVDCGISDFDAAQRAKELGLDLIIVDHHQIHQGKGIPTAHSVLNPQRSDCESGLKELCGCGLAFYLAMALRIRLREKGWFATGTEPNLKQHLDLVTIATAADQVPLLRENRILVRNGMEVLKNTSKPGVRALIQVSGLRPLDISSGDLAFSLGPRINASGRMRHAGLAYRLLTAVNWQEALNWADELEKLNAERVRLQNRIWTEVRENVENGIAEGRFQNGIVVASADWHEGVIGIVAAKAAEQFYKPAIVIAIKDGVGKGSARSYGEVDILKALRACSDDLLGCGGHRYAAGLSVAREKIENFSIAFDRALDSSQDEDRTPLWIDGECSMGDLGFQTLTELEALGPFGPGNPEPVFSLKAGAEKFQLLKNKHLKFKLVTQDGSLEAIWFHAAANTSLEKLPEKTEWAGVPELNRYGGRVTPTFRIKGWRAY